MRPESRPRTACRCARKASTWCQTLFKSPSSLAAACCSSPAVLDLPEARGSRKASRRWGCSRGWAPHTCSAFSWRSLRQGSSVSWEGQHRGRDAPGVGMACLPRSKAERQKREGWSSAEACLIPARSGGPSRSLGPRCPGGLAPPRAGIARIGGCTTEGHYMICSLSSQPWGLNRCWGSRRTSTSAERYRGPRNQNLPLTYAKLSPACSWGAGVYACPELALAQ